jgi:polyhydroxyalkanoate synthesis repressor PhaR
MSNTEDVILIKKYSNRRLYNTQISEYITHLELIELIKSDQAFKIIDAENKEDITRSVLIQIICEQEQKGYNLFPDSILKQLIKGYDDKICGHFSEFLSQSISMFFDKNTPNDKEEFSNYAYSSMKLFNDITRRNMEILGKSMQMFTGASAKNATKEDV